MCEQLVDVEESFQLWRFRHMKTVERIIGYKRGTGGSSGVSFLRKALELTFFPELLEVRTVIGTGVTQLERPSTRQFARSQHRYCLTARRAAVTCGAP